MFKSLAALLLAAVATSLAHADTRVRILTTEPSDKSTLAVNDTFYVNVEYTTDQPIHLWAYPYFRGKQVKHARTNASTHYFGKGRAVGWFSLTEAGQVDEVRIVAGGGEPWHRWDVASLKLHLNWTGESVASRTSDDPDWADEDLESDTETAQREETRSGPARSSASRSRSTQPPLASDSSAHAARSHSRGAGR